MNFKKNHEENCNISSSNNGGPAKSNYGNNEQSLFVKPLASLRSAASDKDSKAMLTRKVDKSAKGKISNTSSMKTSQKSHSKLKEHLKNW